MPFYLVGFYCFLMSCLLIRLLVECRNEWSTVRWAIWDGVCWIPSVDVSGTAYRTYPSLDYALDTSDTLISGLAVWLYLYSTGCIHLWRKNSQINRLLSIRKWILKCRRWEKRRIDRWAMVFMKAIWKSIVETCVWKRSNFLRRMIGLNEATL